MLYTIKTEQKMIYRIPYEVYRFDGKLIDRKTYDNLKSAFTANPYLNFPEPKSYYEEHKGEATFVLITLGICLILTPFGESIDGTFLMLVLALSFIGLVFGVIFQFTQFQTFQKAKKRQAKFFNDLKDDIIQSATYEELISLQRPKINKMNR